MTPFSTVVCPAGDPLAGAGAAGCGKVEFPTGFVGLVAGAGPDEVGTVAEGPPFGCVVYGTQALLRYIIH